ncbi:hypothetical protein GCM10027343_10300 [Noviherbaspirillum agri]
MRKTAVTYELAAAGTLNVLELDSQGWVLPIVCARKSAVLSTDNRGAVIGLTVTLPRRHQ